MYDVAIVGAGPVGIACAIEARRRGLSDLVIDKGALVNSLTGYPTNMELFSTPDLLEIGGHPFATHRYKPIREEAIDYYQRVALAEKVNLRLYERVDSISGEEGSFTIETDKGRHYARTVVIATGFFDIVNPLGAPGEELDKVLHYYREPYRFAGCKVVVVGAKNSAAKVALECYRQSADVTMVIRDSAVSDSVKYWIKPDLENRIAEGAIKAFFNSTVTDIRDDEVDILTPNGDLTIQNDFVLAMTGYRPDYGFLDRVGIGIGDDEADTPILDDNFETTRRGVFMAGTICGGMRTGRWFIENGRDHARIIATEIARRFPVESKGVEDLAR